MVYRNGEGLVPRLIIRYVSVCTLRPCDLLVETSDVTIMSIVTCAKIIYMYMYHGS